MDTQGIAALNYYNLVNNNNNPGNRVSETNFSAVLTDTRETAYKDSTSNAEELLQEIYPDVKYHVLDASQFTYWNRLDFPDSKLFEDTIDAEALKSWKPKTPAATGYEPWVQQDLAKIKKGIHAVFIHPAVQEKMDKDPDYARQIVNKIQNYFENDIKINEAIDPDSVKSMSQAVVVTEDGEIGNHVTVCDGPLKTASKTEETGRKKEKEDTKTLRLNSYLSPDISGGTAAAPPLEYDYRYIFADIDVKKRK